MASEGEDAAELPTMFDLVQNYPIPFNPTTTIMYSCPIQSDMTLIIYDVQGKPVRTLVDERQSPGMHSITWEMKMKPSMKIMRVAKIRKTKPIFWS